MSPRLWFALGLAMATASPAYAGEPAAPRTGTRGNAVVREKPDASAIAEALRAATTPVRECDSPDPQGSGPNTLGNVLVADCPKAEAPAPPVEGTVPPADGTAPIVPTPAP